MRVFIAIMFFWACITTPMFGLDLTDDEQYDYILKISNDTLTALSSYYHENSHNLDQQEKVAIFRGKFFDFCEFYLENTHKVGISGNFNLKDFLIKREKILKLNPQYKAYVDTWFKNLDFDEFLKNNNLDK
jgi:hypothetical protein